MHYGRKKQTNLAAWRLIIQKRVSKKSYLEKYKTDLQNHLITEIAQIYKIYGQVIENQ